jgi:hypothetical protein
MKESDDLEAMIDWLGRPRFDGTMIQPQTIPQSAPMGLRLIGDAGRIKWIPS